MSRQKERKSRSEKSKEKLHDKIRTLVNEGQTDAEIAFICKMYTREVYFIRRNILQISNWGRKRKCPGCQESVSINLFNFKSGGGLCLNCRRLDGQDHYQRRTPGNATRRVIRPRQEEVLCLRCEKVFLSEVFIGLGGRETHFFTCEKCRKIIEILDRLAVDGGATTC